jgi:hypothetical protein
MIGSGVTVHYDLCFDHAASTIGSRRHEDFPRSIQDSFVSLKSANIAIPILPRLLRERERESWKTDTLSESRTACGGKHRRKDGAGAVQYVLSISTIDKN